ncbi:MAG: exo-alpha-sialidase [Candidatus Competibacteraceae bacterium]|nr:exo-alpha-sialidase [Candidatus Competibacteraceae bacterium]
MGPLVFYASLVGATEWQVNEAGFNAKRPPQLVVNATGDAAVGYYDAQGRILARSYGNHSVMLNPGDNRGPATGLAMVAAGKHLYAAWREQRAGNFVLLLRHSPDYGLTWEDETVVDTLTHALTRIVLTADQQGRLNIAWLGQQPLLNEQASVVSLQDIIPEQKPLSRTQDASKETGTTERRREAVQQKPPATPSYHIYARHFADHGKTWGKTYRLTAGYSESIWPTLLSHGDITVSFSWSQQEDKKKILFTHTEADGSWKKPTVIKEVNNVLILKAYSVGERLLVLWLDKNKNDFLIEGAFSDDGGQQWQLFSLDNPRNLDIANIELASQQTNLHLVFSARTDQRTEPWKQTVYYARSVDGGAHWDKPKSLRHYPFPYTKALYPRIVATDDSVTAVWNDFRNIRGDLYLNTSENAGEKWLPEDVAIDSRGRHNDYLYPFSASFQQIGNTYYLLAGRYQKDALGGQADLILHRFELPQTEPPTDLLSDSGSPNKQALLRTAANRLWSALVKNDYRTAYPLFDPFFRANLREVDYLAATGRVVYRSFKINEVAVRGNIGRVSVEYEYEIPAFATKQGTVTRPLTKANAVGQWLFIQDNWYKEYSNELGEFTYARY